MMLISGLLIILGLVAGAVEAEVVPTYLPTLASLEQPPQVYRLPSDSSGMTKFYFEAEPYQGKATRVFAIYHTPSHGQEPFPAVVLVHGGGGSAFTQWIKKWNDAGFAALSIAVEGQTDVRIPDTKNKWHRHAWAGPARAAIYGDSDLPIPEQWMFHATSAVIRAHTLLRSFPEVDSKRIGLSGISWGGVITSTVLGFDQRFAFAIPIYGSGSLDEMNNQYGIALKDNQLYRSFWEPMTRIVAYQGPTLWMTGLNEQHFSLDAQAATYRQLSGPRAISIQANLKHGHGAGWAPPEPYAFARSVVNDLPLPVVFNNENVSGNELRINVRTETELTAASLFTTTDLGHTGQRQWREHRVNIEPTSEQLRLVAQLPPQATAWFFNVTSDGMTFSSNFSQR